MRKSTFYQLAFAALIILSSLSNAFAQSDAKTPFSGNWTINNDKSDFGQMPHYVISKQFTLSASNNQINLTLIMGTPAGTDTTINETLPLNGTNVHIGGSDNRQRTVTAQLSAHKDTLTIKTSASVPGDALTEQYKINETWTLSNSGSTLAIKKTVTTTDDGDQYTVTGVYDKN